MRWMHIAAQPVADYAFEFRCFANGTKTLYLNYSQSAGDTPRIEVNGVDQVVSLASTNRWQFTYDFDGSDQSIKCFVDDNNSLLSTSQWIGTTELEAYFADLKGFRNGLTLNRNTWNQVVLPDETNGANQITIYANQYDNPIDAECEIIGNAEYQNLFLEYFNRMHIDISTLNLSGVFRVGGGGNTTSTNHSCYTITFPALNTNDFTSFLIGKVYQTGVFDFSGWTGNFSGVFWFTCQGQGPKDLTLPPNLENVTEFYVGNNRTLGTKTHVLDSKGNTIPSTILYRNGIRTNGTYNPTFDLTDWDMSTYLRLDGFGNDFVNRVFFAPSNLNDFSHFEIERMQYVGSEHLDFSNWTGNFSGDMFFQVLYNVSQISFPPNKAGVTRFSLSQVSILGNQGVDLTDINSISNLFIYRNDVGGSGANRIIDITGVATNDALRVYSFADNRPVNWQQFIFDPINTNDFRLFYVGNLNQSTLDFSGWTGQIDVAASTAWQTIIWGNPNLTSLSLGFTLIRCDRFIVRNNPLLDWVFDFSTLSLTRSSSYVDFSKNALSNASITTMINQINSENARFSSGHTFNFSRRAGNTAGGGNVGSNAIPTAGDITTMINMNSSYGFKFVYWDGATNIKIG